MSSVNICYELLGRTRSQVESNAIYQDKIHHKDLPLRSTSPNDRTQRRIRRHQKGEDAARRRKLLPLSAKEIRLSEAHAIPTKAQKFELYLPLHRLWLRYIKEVLDMDDLQPRHTIHPRLGNALASADFHGAELLVVQARCASLVGLRGIVVKDTKFTFQVITRIDELKVIPKRNTVFRFTIGQGDPNANAMHAAAESFETKHEALVFDVRGSQFEYRSVDRATKRFKPKNARIL